MRSAPTVRMYVVGRVGQEGAARIRCLGDRLVVTPRGNQCPAGHGVEGADEDQRRIGGARDGAFGITGLVAEDRGGLEADVADQGEQQPDAQRAGEDRARVDDARREPVLPTASDDHQIQDQYDGDLCGQQHRKHPAGQLNVAIAEERRNGERRRRERPPRQGGSAEQCDDVATRRTEQAVDPRLDRNITHQGDEGDADAGWKAKGCADIREERTRLLDVRRQRRETDGEQQQDDGRDDEGSREPGAVARRDAQRYDSADDAERCRCGDDHEDDGRDAEVAPQLALAGGRWAPQCVWRSDCFGHARPPFVGADHRLSGTIGSIRWLKPHLKSA